MSATRASSRSAMPSSCALRFSASMNREWLSTATMRNGELSARTNVWAPGPQPMSSTRVPAPTSGTSPPAVPAFIFLTEDSQKVC